MDHRQCCWMRNEGIRLMCFWIKSLVSNKTKKYSTFIVQFKYESWKENATEWCNLLVERFYISWMDSRVNNFNFHSFLFRFHSIKSNIVMIILFGSLHKIFWIISIAQREFFPNREKNGHRLVCIYSLFIGHWNAIMKEFGLWFSF